MDSMSATRTTIANSGIDGLHTSLHPELVSSCTFPIVGSTSSADGRYSIACKSNHHSCQSSLILQQRPFSRRDPAFRTVGPEPEPGPRPEVSIPPNGPPQLTLEMLIPTSLAADDQPLKSSPESRLPIQQSQLIDETSTKTTYHPIGATMGSARLAGPGEGITVDARQNQRRC